jgi:drug/metabolite transporter (DMT)-like permease
MLLRFIDRSRMPIRLLFVAFTVNSVISQLVLRRGLRELGSPSSLHVLPRFLGDASLSPWIYASVALQILSYVMWMLIVSREKLGVATATVGAGFYTLMALSAWLIYGESLTPMQWSGIVLVTAGVVCISLGGVPH